MRTRRLLLLTTSIALLAAGLAGPAAAADPAGGVQPSTPSNAAWVTVRSPGLASYTPAAADRGNTTGGVNRVVRTAVGRWQVRFPGIRSGAVAQVVAMNTQPRRCQITKSVWNAGGGYSSVNVACFTPDGTPVDTRFVATIVRKGTSGDAARFLGLAQADQPSTVGETTPVIRHNSMGGSVAVERVNVGEYSVRFTTPLDDHKSIAVATAVSSPLQPRSCQVTGWSYDETPPAQGRIYVRCQDGTGVAADSRFNILYAVRAGLEGILGGPTATFWSDRDTNPDPWKPMWYYDYSSANKRGKITHVSTGVYRVTLQGMPSGGAAIVNAYTDGLNCQIGSIRTSGTPQKVEVRCFLFDGTTADAEFDFAYTK